MAFTIRKDEVIKYPPETLRSYKVFIYEWIDNLHFTSDPAEFLSNPDEYLKIAAALFTEAGWYGDGDIRLIWIPPFVHHEYGFGEDAYGTILWHVKQEEDGLSFILSPTTYPVTQTY